MLSLKESVAFDTGTLIWSGQIAADYNHCFSVIDTYYGVILMGRSCILTNISVFRKLASRNV